MARSYHMIRNIVGETGTWRIKIKAIYQWKTYEQNGEVNGIHTILIDEKGTRIQAIISKYVLSAHQDKIKEGKHYYIIRFKVTENIGDYKPTKHNHKIIFLKNSVIRNCNDITIPADRFNFANFNDILALKYDTTVLTDIIAEVTAYSNVNDGFKLSINLELIDEENNQILGRFWEQYAEEIYSYVSKPENNKSFVIFIQYAKVKIMER
ncbi:replication protein A 70 kDa DNA-binding subunit B-like [Amaranthus tricolor]|uniref:replication protein A 70 kDa DNA-binding subunit B-like n=1 Tax=Amaranthus tricolor TaxID=29722 RepID=UPI00258D337E|nr:replication protein A 70 kDa DNA-binding subunit B-like [Amaranthus tricolor]